jgi:hypothetical protein
MTADWSWLPAMAASELASRASIKSAEGKSQEAGL